MVLIFPELCGCAVTNNEHSSDQATEIYPNEVESSVLTKTSTACSPDEINLSRYSSFCVIADGWEKTFIGWQTDNRQSDTLNKYLHYVCDFEENV